VSKLEDLKKLADALEKKSFHEDYGFVLEWTELPDELRERKIEEYIRFNYMGDNLSEEDQELDEDQIFEKYLSSADNEISARFPIYF